MDRRLLRDTGLTTAMLNLYSCRVYLTPGQLHRLTDDVTGGLAHACVDFRFHYHLGRYWLYAYLSVWTSPPASRAHTPNPAERRTDSEGAAPATASRHEFVEVSRRFSTKLHSTFPSVDLTVLEQFHRPPRFWVIAGSGARSAYGGGSGLTRFSTALLSSGPADTGVADSVLTVRLSGAIGNAADQVQSNGRLPLPASKQVRVRVLRRFLPDEGAPCFLLIPDPQLPPKVQEDAAREVIYGLTEIETRVAAELFDHTTDLEMDRSLLRIYDAVAWRASVLWDQLAMYLPDAVGKDDLDRVHQLIQLIHLVLLQGIADLESVYSSVVAATGSVQEQSERVGERFDGWFTEYPSSGQDMGVRDGLRRSGYIARSVTRATQICAEADRVRTVYQALLSGIGDAFDEKRVRHTDKIADLAIGVGVAAGLVALVAEAGGAVLRYFDVEQSAWSLVVFGLLAGLLAIVIKFLYRGFTSSVGRVISAEFKARYEDLRGYLLSCRTDRLERMWAAQLDGVKSVMSKESIAPSEAWRRYYVYWNEEDCRLASALARQIDAFHSGGMPGLDLGLPRDESDDPRIRELSELESSLERWTLVAMLASERPRGLYRFPLPRLTLLYRYYPILQDELQAKGVGNGSLVADADLTLALRVHCSARREDMRDVERWGARVRELAERGELTASAFVAYMNEHLRLGAGLTQEEWTAVVRCMRRDPVGTTCDGRPEL